jgi:hypothetical protein
MHRAILLSALLAFAPIPLLAQVDPLLQEVQAESNRIQELWKQKKYAEGLKLLAARAESDAFLRLSAEVRAGIHYNMACAAALLGRSGEALACLGEAVGAGFKDWNNLSADTDLDSIRTEPGFRWLAETVRRRGDYRGILQRFAAYATEPSAKPVFTYQDAGAADLVRFKEAYRLEEVAGQGSEFERAVRLLHWVHAQVRHDGNSKNPEPINALNLLEVCRSEKRGINCRMMATILNEACLALGLKSRLVGCLPLDEQDPDSHVINAVWSEAHGKWLYLDPTNDVWLADENGAPLSVADVRLRLITGQPLRISEGANWNGRPLVAAHYFSYMAKNLVRISCPMESAFGYESRPQRKFVTLDSTALIRKPRGKEGSVVVYDPAGFWSRP